MQTVIKAAIPLCRVACRAPLRTLLFATASIVALSAAPRAEAQNECGLPVAGAVTCPVDLVGPDYPDGITYNSLADLTVNVDDAVAVNGSGIGLLTAGNGTVNAPNANINASAGLFVAGAGITATSVGASTVTAGGTITSTDDGVRGIFVSGGDSATVTWSGVITTTGADAHGIVAISPGPVTLDVGDVSATGEGANGVAAVSTGDAVNLTVNGNVQGGWFVVNEVPPAPPLPSQLPTPTDPGELTFATGVLAAGLGEGGVTITNNGEIGSLSDSAIIAFGPTITVENAGTVTGYVDLIGDTVTFNNTSSTSLDLRNFADTDGDGVRDTEAASISDFGGAGVFNNTGAVAVLNVAAPLVVNPLDSISLPIVIPPSFYDINTEGVEHAALIGLSEFRNAGSIIMQDALTGGSGPVAGDVLLIAGAGGEVPTVATYFSEGGTLALDTVLNQGGVGASQSDILLLQATELGAGGPTLVQIANAGGSGAQTVEDGILLVNVADPALSASGVFELDGYVIEGAYQYELFQGGDPLTGGDPLDGNWYLRSDLSPTTEIYRGLTSSILRFTRETIGTVQQRSGNRWWRVPESSTTRTVTEPSPPPPPTAMAPRNFVVYFDWDRSNLSQEAMQTINEAAAYAQTGRATRVIVAGHTDTSGSTDYNEGLSQRRATVVGSALQQLGVSAEIVDLEALGETDLAVATPDGVREQQNRRSTIQVQTPGQAAAGPPPPPRTRTVTEVVPASTEIQGAGAWGRIIGSDAEYQGDDDLSAQLDDKLWIAQFGWDFVISQSDTGTTIGSVFGHYGESETDVSTDDFGEIGTIDQTGYGLGGSVTWYSPDGAYVDGAASFNWFETDLNSGALGDLSESNDGTGWAISAEGGMRYETSPNYFVVPQAQLLYSSADFDDFTDQFDATVGIDDQDSFIGRLGVAFEYQKREVVEGGEINRMQAYGVASLVYDFMGSTGVTVNDISIEDENDDIWGDFSGGMTYSFSDAWSVYGEIGYRTSLENWGDSEVVRGNFGARYNW